MMYKYHDIGYTDLPSRLPTQSSTLQQQHQQNVAFFLWYVNEMHPLFKHMYRLRNVACLSFMRVYLNPVVGRPGLPGNARGSAAATRVVANGGLCGLRIYPWG